MRFVIALIVAASATPALGQERPTAEGWNVTVGAGALAAPTYEGDDSYRLSVLPNIQVSHDDTFFASVQEGVGYRVINSERLRAGPIARIRFSRDENGDQPFALTGDDSTDLTGLGDVGTSLELGGFVEYHMGDISFSAEARQAASGHAGLVAEIGARWSGRYMSFGPPIIWSFGPRARFVDETLNAAYFGVTSAQSVASGLPVYSADGGLQSFGLGGTAIIPLDKNSRWAAVAFAGYDRLTGAAAESPLVQLRGSEDQATLGLFLSYRLY